MIFCLILVIKSLFIASLFISSSVTGNSLMVLAIMFLISQSVRKVAIIVSSKGSLYFGTNLDSPSAWLICFDGRYSILNCSSVKSFPILVAYWQYKLVDPFLIQKWLLGACGLFVLKRICHTSISAILSQQILFPRPLFQSEKNAFRSEEEF